MKLTTHLLLCLLATVAFAPEAGSTRITVDVNGQGDYSTLFNGIYYAYQTASDTVLVYPGTYSGPGNRNLTLPEMDFVLVSRDGPEVTIVDPEIGNDGIAFSPFNTTSMVIEGFTFRNSTTGYSDYGILVVNGAGCTIRSCVFGNQSKVWLEDAGTRRIENCVFTGNNYALKIRDNDHTTVRSCTFRGNRPAIELIDYGNYSRHFSAIDCTFEGNSTAMDFYTRGSVVIDSCSFSGNTAGTYPYSGACIDLVTSGSLAVGRISNCSFIGNSSGRHAGAIALDGDYAPIFMEDCVFEGNSANQTGGAVRNWGSRFTMTRCSFSGNTAVTGSAVYTGEDNATGAAQIIDCVFVENEAANGGAVAATHEMTIITGCEFTRNTADMGAAVFGRENLTEITDCLFSENRAHIWGGGACFVDVQRLPGIKLYNSTFERNYSHRGAAVLFDATRGTVRECTLFGDRSADASIVCTRAARIDLERCIASFASSGAAVALQLDSRADVTNCVVFGNAGGDSLTGDLMYLHGNLFTDPLFCDIASSDYSLCENSPCLPDNNDWGVQIGAHGQGCGPCDNPVKHTSWGSIKAMFR